ncbi:recombinase family protein [Rhodococcus erythropolis]|uniref:recombinase family protein n=1 Tax=Rhodococcus erythropolis TaxID=1833 RepID=UPI00294A156B|nr:recombinase family protein [Rhodococcus erythropolis]MDV6277901.1 recombinase family protein [Rhodococcus erythropolis]
MLIGYARVSSTDQNPDHQVDALRRAGVAAENIHLDHASGAKSSRPQLDLVQQRLRADDVLVITRLDRLGRSMLHLITLGADLRERRIGLKVLEQGIDTATAEGRAMFGMLTVLAEFQRELIAANTRSGLATARAHGRKGGRPPKLGSDQIERAQRLYDAGDHTVAQIADMLKVPRTTVYGHLNKRRVDIAPLTQEITGVVDPPASTARTCPTCGYEPTTRAEAVHQRADLAVSWLHTDPHHHGTVVIRHHCRQCEPGQPAFDIACSICGDGPILTGPLAEQETSDTLTEPVQRWLTATGWTVTPDLLCPAHAGDATSSTDTYADRWK